MEHLGEKDQTLNKQISYIPYANGKEQQVQSGVW